MTEPILIPGSPVNSGTIFSAVTADVDINVSTSPNRLAIAFLLVRGWNGNALVGVTYGGQPMTQCGQSATNGNISALMFRREDAEDNIRNIEATFTGAVGQCVLMAAAWMGVDTDLPALDQSAFATGNDTLPFVELNPTEADELFVACCIHESSVDLATGAGETVLYNNDNGAWVTSASWDTDPTSNPKIMDWVSPQSDLWAVVGASFRPSPYTNFAPEVTLITEDDALLANMPTLEFVASDVDGDPGTFQIQISTDDNFSASGVTEMDSCLNQSGLVVHPQPTLGGGPDDRPGQSFTGQGGYLDSIVMLLGDMTTYDPEGTCYVRVYEHQGVFGTSSAPLNPALPENTPTPNWLAISDGIPLTPASVGAEFTFNFTGANRIVLEDGVRYVLIHDWVADYDDSDNSYGVLGSSQAGGAAHDGNFYNDGDSVNNGYVSDWDMYFKSFEVHTLLDEASAVDSGFYGTPDNTDPFDTDQVVSYTVHEDDMLDWNLLYHWRVRAQDPTGSGLWSLWTTPRQFNVRFSIRMDLDAGSYSINGYDVEFVIHRALVMETGQYTIVGKSVTILLNTGAAHTAILHTGYYTIIGHPVEMYVQRIMHLDAGLYEITGHDADLQRGTGDIFTLYDTTEMRIEAVASSEL